jgi:hypothetical protein
MNSKKCNLLAFGLLILQTLPATAVEPENEPIIRVLEAINCNSGPFKPKFPKSISEFRSLGNRTKEQIQEASDYTGDPKTHTSAIFWYEKMIAGVVFKNTKPYGMFLEGAIFSSPRWNYITPIKIGANANEVLRKFNLAEIPANSTAAKICSAVEFDAPDCIHLAIKGGLITSVQYVCYTG